MRLVLLGCPGAGKGTQAQYICDKYQIAQISASDVLRDGFEAGEIDLATKQAMDRGELVPDELIIKLIKKRIERPDCKNGYLFDGFPRTIPQAQALIEAEIDIDVVLEIYVTDAEVIRRLAGRRVHLASGRSYHLAFNPPIVANTDDVTGEELVHREDDKPATVKKRLKIYHQRTEPLRQFYRDLVANSKKGPVLLAVSGDHSVAVVKDEIFRVLDAVR